MTADATWVVRALGPLRVDGPDGPVDLGGPRPRTVFALLLVEGGRPVSTDRLVDETWAASPPPGARRTLQAYVAGLRRALGGDDGPLHAAAGAGELEGGHVLDVLDADERFDTVHDLLVDDALASAKPGRRQSPTPSPALRRGWCSRSPAR